MGRAVKSARFFWSASLFSNRTQLLGGEFRGAGLAAHARKFYDGKFLHIASIPHARTYKHVIPASQQTSIP